MLKEAKKYYSSIDLKAKELVNIFLSGKQITEKMLDIIHELYDSHNLKNYNSHYFESKYQQTVTNNLEFLIARILDDLSEKKKLNWKIYLRRQKKGCTPDIRIEKYGTENTLAIIEIKAKAGWIQGYFSKERAQDEKKINQINEQLKKYENTFKINKKRIYLILPTFVTISRKNSKEKIKDFRAQFKKNSKLPEKNLIIFSNNIALNLQKPIDKKETTNDFENLLKKLTKLQK